MGPALKKLKPLALRQGGTESGMDPDRLSTTTHDIGSEVTFGPLQELKLHGFTLIQRTVAVFLDGGEMH